MLYWISYYLEYLSGVVYGMPVSGLQIPGIITTQYAESNLLNGGAFGIEGGILTTIVTLLSFYLYGIITEFKLRFLKRFREPEVLQ